MHVKHKLFHQIIFYIQYIIYLYVISKVLKDTHKLSEASPGISERNRQHLIYFLNDFCFYEKENQPSMPITFISWHPSAPTVSTIKTIKGVFWNHEIIK